MELTNSLIVRYARSASAQRTIFIIVRAFSGLARYDDILRQGVVVEVLAVPGAWTYDVKRKDDRIIAITWQVNIKPGECAEFGFVARNPRDKSQIVWTLRQRFADGTVTDWTNGPNGTRPTAVTTLAPMKTP